MPKDLKNRSRFVGLRRRLSLRRVAAFAGCGLLLDGCCGGAPASGEFITSK